MSIENKLKNIIFDFDGVIGDTHDINLKITNEVFNNTISKQQLSDHLNGNSYEEPVIPFCSKTSELFTEKYASEMNYSYVEKAMSFLKGFRGQKNYYIISSNDELSIRAALESDVDQFLEILGRETDKSKIKKFKIIEGRHSTVDPNNSIFITDSIGDVKEAKKAGYKSIAVTFGYQDEEVLLSSDPDYLCRSWNEVKTVIDNLS